MGAERNTHLQLPRHLTEEGARATKRALSLGYSDVAWYREGTDGWAAAGLPLQEATPELRP